MTQSGSAPIWWNFSGNIEHLPPTDGQQYYFTPTSLAELQAVLTAAKQNKVTVRVSGQRHSQPPLVTDDNRSAPPLAPTTYLVDMSCYVDVGQNGMALGPGPNQITVNPGVREDYVDAFLTQNNLIFQTVTAGGFFSLGGMTAVDVHGATVEAPIFSETASAFVILDANGNLNTIDATQGPVNGWTPMQFARVSLGGLGIVTQIILDVQPRPYANTLQGGTQWSLWNDQASFVAGMQEMLTAHDRLEVFFTPYAAPWSSNNFLVLWWDIVADPNPTVPNSATDPTTACVLSQEGQFGAGMIPSPGVADTQYMNPFGVPYAPAAAVTLLGLKVIELQAGLANKDYSELWLSEASQVMFMSYFIELPNLDAAGLGLVWNGLDAVTQKVLQKDNFHIAAPMEFRFVKGGNSAMSGAYSTNADAYFINLDLIGFVPRTPSADYNTQLLQFFADVERAWVAMGGFPHNGKMYGFYDPTLPAGTYTAAFNPNFLAALRTRRGARLQAFNNYRQQQDPTGLFYNEYLRMLMEG